MHFTTPKTPHLLSTVLLVLSPLTTLTQTTSPSTSQNLIDSTTTVPFTSFNKSADSFVLGGLFSFTSGGVISEKGVHRAEAFKCAVKRFNDQGLLPGKTVYYEIADDGDNAIYSVYKTMGLINRGRMAVVGAAGSSLTDADSKVLSSFNIPMVSYASSAASLADIARYPTLVRTVANDNFQTSAMISLALEFGWSLVGAIGTDDTYGSSGISSFVDGATQAGLKIPCSKIVSATNLAGIQEFQTCLEKSTVKVVVLFTSEQPAAAIITSLYKANAIPSDMIFIASDSWSTTLVPTLLKQNNVPTTVLQGTISTIQWPGDLSGFKTCLGGLTPQNNNYTLFNQYWEKRFSCTTDPFATTAQCVNSLTGRDGKCRCTYGGVETLANDTPNNKAALVDDAVYAVLNAIRTLIYDCTSLPLTLQQQTCFNQVITAQNILDAIRALTFQGLSGEVAFSGVDRTSVSFSYTQYNGSTWNTVGQWTVSGTSNSTSVVGNNGGARPVINLNQDALVWRPGSDYPPQSIIIPDTVRSNDKIAIVVKTLSALGILTTVLFAAYFLRAHDHAVIKRASPLFCVLMLFGMMLIYIDMFLWDGDQNKGLCVAKVWVPLIGFGFVMGPMLVKTFRIYKIFDTRRIRATSRLQDTQLLGLSSIVIAGEIILLLVWTAADPLHPQLIESDASSSDLYTTIKCVGNNDTFQLGMWGAFVAYNCGLLLLGILMSYKTRNVHSSFNESKYIAYAIYNISLCVAVLLPIYMTIGDVKGAAQRAYIVRSLATLFANTACMLILFGPKFYQVYRDAKLEEYDSSGERSGSSAAAPGPGQGGPGHPMNRRGSSGLMFASPQPRGRQASAGKDFDKGGKKGAPQSAAANLKVLKSVKAIEEESSKGEMSGKGDANSQV